MNLSIIDHARAGPEIGTRRLPTTSHAHCTSLAANPSHENRRCYNSIHGRLHREVLPKASASAASCGRKQELKAKYLRMTPDVCLFLLAYKPSLILWIFHNLYC